MEDALMPCDHRFSGSNHTIEEGIQLAKEAAKHHKYLSFDCASTEAEMQSLWSARKEALWACLAVRPEGTQIWSTDVAVPISKMAELIGKTLATSNNIYLLIGVNLATCRSVQGTGQYIGLIPYCIGPCRRW